MGGGGAQVHEKLVDVRREVTHTGRETVLYLVAWEGYLEGRYIWESEETPKAGGGRHGGK